MFKKKMFTIVVIVGCILLLMGCRIFPDPADFVMTEDYFVRNASSFFYQCDSNLGLDNLMGEDFVYEFDGQTITGKNRLEWQDYLNSIIPDKMEFTQVNFSKDQMRDSLVFINTQLGMTTVEVEFEVTYYDYDGEGNKFVKEVVKWDEVIEMQLGVDYVYPGVMPALKLIKPTNRDFLEVFHEKFLIREN